MSSLTKANIEAQLALFLDPYLQQDWVTLRAIKDIVIQHNTVDISITLGYPFKEKQSEWEAHLQQLLQPILGHRQLHVHFTMQIEPHVGKSGITALPNVKNIIAIASGKGGVGKSMLAVNLALALAQEGAEVGILDADIYGPSQPVMLGVQAQPDFKDKQNLLPIVRHGIQSMSMGYLVNEKTAMVWRGPMISMAMQQLLNQTSWDALDYLIVDLPPGTGDVQLTLAQKIPVSAAVIVTTPQDLALADARRACEMFRKLQVPILGVVENMSYYQCAHCQHKEHLFGQDGGSKLAQQFAIDLLGAIPLDKQIRVLTDGGVPPVIQSPQGEHAILFRQLARTIAAKLSLQKKDYSGKFPKVVVKQD
ncbi:MAG: ATPase [Gammaproteobacteria bacterium RIFCSPHIGHO2_12_FULL_41_20]|nr:MAG: ATPase [Gammaproteobacteria bacterium RIFCSPHIGHO2_12_FULL_41_20]